LKPVSNPAAAYARPKRCRKAQQHFPVLLVPDADFAGAGLADIDQHHDFRATVLRCLRPCCLPPSWASCWHLYHALAFALNVGGIVVSSRC
jgi:hypothetical protein